MANSPSDFRQLLHRYEHGRCTPAEKRRVEDWYRQLGAAGQPFDLSGDEREALMRTVWQRISHRTATGGPARRLVLGWPAPVRWAAAAALLFGLVLVGLQTYRTVHGGAAARLADELAAPPARELDKWQVYANNSTYEAQVALPDGSAVALAPASTLRYPRTFGAGQRVVYLTGEAFFEVFHDAQHPFLVFTDEVVTRVLGTSFRVRARAADVQVQVRTGAVRVSSRARPLGAVAASLVVRPNQQAVYSPARHQLRRELLARPVLLAPQSFVFRDQPVEVVLAALEKAYGVDIVHDAAALRNCTLTLALGPESLFEKLDIISQTLGATYEQADGHIVFHSQPCPAD